jgi:hypothetical protein
MTGQNGLRAAKGERHGPPKRPRNGGLVPTGPFDGRPLTKSEASGTPAELKGGPWISLPASKLATGTIFPRRFSNVSTLRASASRIQSQLTGPRPRGHDVDASGDLRLDLVCYRLEPLLHLAEEANEVGDAAQERKSTLVCQPRKGLETPA